MSGSTTKKVLVRRFEREPLAGFVNPRTCFQPVGLELLSVEGTVTVIPYAEVKTVCFVKEFDTAAGPEQKVFYTRPKVDGLWVRMKLRDHEMMEGVLSNNLLQLEPWGFTVTPPDRVSNVQRMFVPRAALLEAQVLGVVGSPLRPRKRKAAPKEQIELFEK